MERPEISVTIPVGPLPVHKKWLQQAIDSVLEQSVRAKEILLIDDMAGLDPEAYPGCRIWSSPWRLGIAHAFNFGIMLSETECVFMLGSDDWLEPDCLQKCGESYSIHKNPGNYYYHVSIRLTDTGKVITRTFTNAAMVSKTLWWRCGGFAVEAGVGAGDYLLSGILTVVHESGRMVPVDPGHPLYNSRVHEEQHTASVFSDFRGAVNVPALQNDLIKRWVSPSTWGRKR